MYREFLQADLVERDSDSHYTSLYCSSQQSQATGIEDRYQDKGSNVGSSSSTLKWSDPRIIIATPKHNPTASQNQCMMNKRTWVSLNLEDLNCFEVVNDQFQQWGIRFKNAIALNPSNTCYPPRSGKMVLMGAPKGGWIEMTFEKPIRCFDCYITASQKTVLSAYNQQNQVLDHAELPEPNLADSDSKILPNAKLQVTHPNIHRITFYAFDGQLTLDDLSLSF